MDKIREKLLDMNVRLELVALMTDDELLQSQSYEDKHDLENYLLALAIKYSL